MMTSHMCTLRNVYMIYICVHHVAKIPCFPYRFHAKISSLIFIALSFYILSDSYYFSSTFFIYILSFQTLWVLTSALLTDTICSFFIYFSIIVELSGHGCFLLSSLNFDGCLYGVGWAASSYSVLCLSVNYIKLYLYCRLIFWSKILIHFERRHVGFILQDLYFNICCQNQLHLLCIQRLQPH